MRGVVIVASRRRVRLRREAAKTLLKRVGTERFKGGDEDVDAQVELALLQ